MAMTRVQALRVYLENSIPILLLKSLAHPLDEPKVAHITGKLSNSRLKAIITLIEERMKTKEI